MSSRSFFGRTCWVCSFRYLYLLGEMGNWVVNTKLHFQHFQHSGFLQFPSEVFSKTFLMERASRNGSVTWRKHGRWCLHLLAFITKLPSTHCCFLMKLKKPCSFAFKPRALESYWIVPVEHPASLLNLRAWPCLLHVYTGPYIPFYIYIYKIYI